MILHKWIGKYPVPSIQDDQEHPNVQKAVRVSVFVGIKTV